MLSEQDRTNILLWVKKYFAEATKTRNNELCAGVECNRTCDEVAKVFILKRLIEKTEELVAGGHEIQDAEIENLYRRLTCLIRLKIS